MLEEMTRAMYTKRDHIVPMYTTLQKRLRQEDASAMLIAGERFAKPPRTLSGFGIDRLVIWVSHRSGLPVDTILKFKVSDKDVVLFMAQFDLQLPANIKIPLTMQVKESRWKLLNVRGDLLGSRLSKWITRTGPYNGSSTELP